MVSLHYENLIHANASVIPMTTASFSDFYKTTATYLLLQKEREMFGCLPAFATELVTQEAKNSMSENDFQHLDVEEVIATAHA